MSPAFTKIRLAIPSFAAAFVLIPSFAFAAPVPLAVIPFKLDGKLMLVEVRIDGTEPVTFVVDTGAPHTVFDSKFARQLGLKLQNAPPTKGTGAGNVARFLGPPVTMVLNGFKVDLPEPWVIDLSKVPIPSTVKGLVGAEIFKAFVVRMDPVQSTFTIFAPDWSPEMPGSAVVPLIVEGDKFFLEATLEVPAGKTKKHKLRIDTGSESSVNDEIVKQSTEVRPAIGGGGLGENFKSYSGVFNSIAIGPYVIRQVWGSGSPGPAIGMELLRRFVVTFDAPHGRLYLEPTSELDTPVPPTPQDS